MVLHHFGIDAFLKFSSPLKFDCNSPARSPISLVVSCAHGIEKFVFSETWSPHQFADHLSLQQRALIPNDASTPLVDRMVAAFGITRGLLRPRRVGEAGVPAAIV